MRIVEKFRKARKERLHERFQEPKPLATDRPVIGEKSCLDRDRVDAFAGCDDVWVVIVTESRWEVIMLQCREKLRLALLKTNHLLRFRMTSNGMVRPCSPRPGVNCQRGERRIGALLCHVAQIYQLPPWASISARIHFTSLAWISVALSSCASDGRAARSEPGWRTCRLA